MNISQPAWLDNVDAPRFPPWRCVIEIRHLKIFTAVYRSKSFTKAAEELYTSQPTVSEHIQNLEARLGCQLFDRLGRSISPTPQAELLYPRAQAILEDIRSLEDDLSASRSRVDGELVVGASTIPGVYLLPPFAARFKKEFSSISFEIQINDSAKIAEAVAARELALGVIGVRTLSSKIHSEPFMEDELIVAASAQLDCRPEMAFDELCRLPMIIRERGSGTRKSTETLLARHDHLLGDLDVVATLGSSAAVKEAIKAGLGVSIISRHAVKEELSRGEVKEIRLRGIDMRRWFYLITSPKRTLPYLYELFRERLLAAGSRPTT